MGLGYGFWALKMTMAQRAKNYLIENSFFFFFQNTKPKPMKQMGQDPILYK
jgi:hypothetical protein